MSYAFSQWNGRQALNWTLKSNLDSDVQRTSLCKSKVRASHLFIYLFSHGTSFFATEIFPPGRFKLIKRVFFENLIKTVANI